VNEARARGKKEGAWPAEEVAVADLLPVFGAAAALLVRIGGKTVPPPRHQDTKRLACHKKFPQKIRIEPTFPAILKT